MTRRGIQHYMMHTIRMPWAAAATPRRPNHETTRSLVRIQIECVWVLRGLARSHSATPQHLHSTNAHTGSRARVTSMGGLYDAATLCAQVSRTSSSIDLLVTYDSRGLLAVPAQ